MKHNTLQYLFGGFTALSLIATGPAAWAGSEPVTAQTTAPRITRIRFAGDTGNITATISGYGFGAAPSGVPCTACTTPLLFLDSQWRCFNPVNITSWTDSQVVFSNLTANPGDPITVFITNSVTQQRAGRAAVVTSNIRLNLPVIKSVKFIGSGQKLGINVSGSGFGSTPKGIPGMVDVPYFGFIDYTENAQGGFQYAWGQNETVLNYVSWSDTQIVISGMQDGWLVPKAGDAVGVEVWNANSCTALSSRSGNSSLTAAWAGTLR